MDVREPTVIAEDLRASYGTGDLCVPVLEDVSFTVARGSVTAVTGPSGSGKTTLLWLIGGLARPDTGRLVVDGHDLTTLDDVALGAFRRRKVGVVFQSFQLLPTLTALENVEAGLAPLRAGRRAARRAAEAALDAVGLLALEDRFPHELSGGEQQRVAVARACAKDPPLLLADEPTGNLDEEVGARVVDELIGAAGAGERTLIVATHDPSIACRADAVLTLRAHALHATPTPGS